MPKEQVTGAGRTRSGRVLTQTMKFWGFIYRQKGALKEEGGDEERRKGIKLMFSVCLYMQGSVNKISPFSDKYLSESLIANRQSAEPKFKPRWSNSRAQACSHFVILLLEY